MKKFIFIVLAVLVSLGGYYFYSITLKDKGLSMNFHQMAKKRADFRKWVTFKEKGGNYSSSFPLKPAEKNKEIPIPGSDSCLQYHERHCTTKGGRLYSISYSKLPDSFLKWGDSLVLNGALRLTMKELGKVELVGKSSNTFKTFPSLDFEHYAKETETAGTLVLVGTILYKVEVTYPHSDHEDIQDELCNFIESFKPVMMEEVTPPSLQQH